MTNRILPKLSSVALAAALAAAPALADHPSAATSEDLRELRTQVSRLDDSLSMLEEDHPRTDEFRRREADIRDELEWLRREIRGHQQDGTSSQGASKDRVDELRSDIVALREDVERAYAASATRTVADLPGGAEIRVRLEQPLSSGTAELEDRVAASLAEAVRQDGRIAIPAGVEVRGHVQAVTRARRPSQGGRLELSFDAMTVDGRRVPMEARVVKVEESIDERRAGLGAVIGGVLGAVLDGGKGALIGAILGGSGAVVASRGEEVQLPAGTVLTLELEQPLAVARR